MTVFKYYPPFMGSGGGGGGATGPTGAPGTGSTFADDIGNASDVTFNVNHGLGSLDVLVQVFDNSSGDQVETGVTHVTTNLVTLTFASAPALDAYRVVVQS